MVRRTGSTSQLKRSQRPMSDSSQRYNELFRKLAALERRVSKIEHGMSEFDAVIDPEGWIGEAFKILTEDVERVEARIEQVDKKIDVILSHITGMGGDRS